jgi:organic hydroperoxide reductase OsmC/OhrA
MSEHRATVHWKAAEGSEFLRGRYSREHTWSFDGGISVPASAAPSVVRAPFSRPDAVDPEEAFVAAIASCHMLTFLHLASRGGFDVTMYEDHAVGTMTKNEAGALWVSSVVLAPRIQYRDREPTPTEIDEMHEAAHRDCFIANSVKTTITVQRT